MKPFRGFSADFTGGYNGAKAAEMAPLGEPMLETPTTDGSWDSGSLRLEDRERDPPCRAQRLLDAMPSPSAGEGAALGSRIPLVPLIRHLEAPLEVHRGEIVGDALDHVTHLEGLEPTPRDRALAQRHAQ